MGSQRCVAVLTSHLVLGVLCLVVGFLCPFQFGWYDSCDLIEPERTFDGWSIYRDMSDFYILLIFIGFILLGVAFGIIGFVQKMVISYVTSKKRSFLVIQWFIEWSIDIKSSEGYEQQAIKLVCIFGAFLIYMPLKILILAEYQG